MCNAPVLAMSDFIQTFHVETDASDTGIGAVLGQNGRPIAFIIKALSPKQQTLSAYEKEMLAITFAVRKWALYLVGRHFIIKIDHQSLKYLLENKIATLAQQDWLTKMMGFDYEVRYRKGITNKAADALSRKPHDIDTGVTKQ
ncbi:Ty3/gypsy retrotransposon protein [Quillaja saponaria]|uniref:Ty3/gypsy retrotransposon protein n=1 Tax=Quillaja saponaria TaxID=32244 RepID=A0AAD7PNV9_QUISA|nr:Ty3/gypsy retrotransposon protein [Quillaja saponaria]